MIVAAVPLKRLTDSKSRLAAHLSRHERADLMSTLVRRTMSALMESEVASRIALVTPETQMANELGVELIEDDGALNSSLLAAVAWAVDSHADGLIILPADLPLLRADDLRQAMATEFAAPTIRINRSQDGGTGLLVLTPADAIEPSFGDGSFERHVNRARKLGVHVHRAPAPAFTYDLDTLDDLRKLGYHLGSRWDCRRDLTTVG